MVKFGKEDDRTKDAAEEHRITDRIRNTDLNESGRKMRKERKQKMVESFSF